MDRAEGRAELLVGGRQLDGDEGDQQDPKRAVERLRIGKEQPDAQHDAGNGEGCGREESEHAVADHCLAGDDVGDQERQQPAQGRGGERQDEGVPERRHRRAELEEGEADILQRRRRGGHELRGDWRERGVDQRGIGKKERQGEHQHGERRRRHAQYAEPDDPRCAVLAAQHGVATSSQRDRLQAQERHGQQQQWQRRRGGQLRLRRELKQAPNLGGERVEARRNGKDCRRAELVQRLQEGDQRTGQQYRQRQRHGDADGGLQGARAQHR